MVDLISQLDTPVQTFECCLAAGGGIAGLPRGLADLSLVAWDNHLPAQSK